MSVHRRPRSVPKRYSSDSEVDSSQDDAAVGMKGGRVAAEGAQGPVGRRRVRGPSKRPCLNKNALMARENRQRKKEYLQSVESKLALYQEENKNLTGLIRKQGIDIKRLNGEVAYLRNVLGNSTNITALLRSMNESLLRLDAHRRHKDSTWMPTKRKEDNPKVSDQIDNSPGASFQEDPRSNGNWSQTMGCSNANTNVGSRSRVSEMDHTYTTHPTMEEDSKLQEDEKLPADLKDLGNFLAEGREVLGFPGAEENGGATPRMEPCPQLMDQDLDDFSALGIHLFDDLVVKDENQRDLGTLDEENLFQGLDNTGICLHLNSEKVSLEFCNICHMNSLNNGDPDGEKD